MSHFYFIVECCCFCLVLWCESDNNQLMMGSLGCIVTCYPMLRLIASARAQYRAVLEIETIYQHSRNWLFCEAFNVCALIIIWWVSEALQHLFALDTYIAMVSARSQGKDGREGCATTFTSCIALSCSSSTRPGHFTVYLGNRTRQHMWMWFIFSSKSRIQSLFTFA